ncbi:hypothetical protein [Armatimonas rosea]|uniref:Uncharacterized protein n=1 Tax=Armatimonas rosea TaxID=685828 RepID=A0A7W9W9C3_ARMRO|nr:hypothetical protein [Armatimonas rosea]MBB6053703.1 hypothetical protein [Armatimonas rosea]
MNLRSPRFFALLAGAALATAALNPLTSNLARTQLGMVFGGSQKVVQNLYSLGLKQEDMPLSWALPAPEPQHTEEAYARTLAAHPDDTELQIAGVLQDTDRTKLLPRLRARAQTSNRPEWHIAALRCACRGELFPRNRAQEQELLSAEPLRGAQDRPIDSAAFERALTDAQRGAALDPSNAFFPAMEALTLYGLKRDSKAQAALHRAALCPRFDDGVRTEMQGTLRLREAALGPQLALTETAVAAATLFPHYASLRALARLATVQAMQKEQAGDIKNGLALRRSVMLLGERVGQQSNNHIGALVGTAMVAVAYGRPGGAPAVASPSAAQAHLQGPPGCLDCTEDLPSAEEQATRKAQAEAVATERLRQWKAFATKNGAKDLVETIVQNRARKETLTATYEKTTDQSLYGVSRVMIQNFRHLTALNLLLSFALVVLLGGIGKLLLRRWPAGEAAHPAVGWGLGLVFCPLLLPVALWKLRKAEGSWGRRLGLLSATWLLPYLAIALLVRAEAGAIAPWLAMVGLMQGLAGGTSAPEMEGAVLLWTSLVGVTLALPLLWLVGLALVSWRRRVPATYGVARGTAQTALPVAAALCVAYALLVPSVAQQERQLKRELAELTASETAYQARLAAQSQR